VEKFGGTPQFVRRRRRTMVVDYNDGIIPNDDSEH